MVDVKPKMLIIPSWYISPSDLINGSFFQAQGRLMSKYFDTRVVFFKAKRRPAIRKIFENPILSATEWMDYIGFADKAIELSDSNAFRDPQLFAYTGRRPFFLKESRDDWMISAWARRVEEMIESGWVPDLIRAHTGFPAGIVAKRIKKSHNIPYVLSEHLPFSIHRYEKNFQAEIREAFEQADRVLSLSYDKVRQLAMSNIDVEPHIIFNMIDEELFRGLSLGYTAGQPLRLVTIGAASFYKDHKTLLRSVRAALDLGVPLHLTMVGLKVWGGDKLDETLRLIGELNLQEHVTIIERLSRAEMAELLPKFDVFLLTSIQEGFPNSVLEALASGLFVLATRHGGTEDIIDNEMGRIVVIKDFTAISKILCDIYLGKIEFDPSHIRRKVLTICGVDAYSERLLDHYGDVINW